MTLTEKQIALIAELRQFTTVPDRLAELVRRARLLPALEPEWRTDTHRIEGCLARLWFVAEFAHGSCQFRCDSDSLVTKGVAALLCEFYSSGQPEEIVAHEPDFLRELGITQHLTPNRRNGLSQLRRRIREFAEQHLSRNQNGCAMRLYDAHNHLQNERFAGRQRELLSTAAQAGVVQMVVNGSCEADWPHVAALAREYPEVIIPSFGYHPWYLPERTPDWLETLRQFLANTPRAVIGEIGLDRWKPELPYDGQEEVFLAQLRLAADLNLPASIHCLQAWGRLHDLLRTGPRPEVGFLLHSYGGPAEMVAPLARLGARFGLPGYFAQERKTRQRQTFRQVPSERLLIETDAPDQALPAERNQHPLTDPATGKPLNHPANLRAVYEFAAELRGVPLAELANQVEGNFQRLFRPDPAISRHSESSPLRHSSPT